jgi:hypothetical protein
MVALAGLELLGQPCSTPRPLQRVADLGGIGQQRAQVGPDQLIQLLSGDIAGLTALPLGHPQRVGAPAAQVVAVASLGPAEDARQPTHAAADQRAQQVLVAGVARGTLLVGVQLGLHPSEGLLGDDLGDRHRDPVLLRPWGVAFARADRQQRRLASAGWHHPSAVGQRPARIGGVAQDAAHAGRVPVELTRFRLCWRIQVVGRAWVSLASREVQLGVVAAPVSQASRRTRLMASAVNTCCRWVLARPR